MHALPSRLRLPVLALALATLVACGGGGGSTTTVLVPAFAPPDLFEGSYAYHTLYATQGGPEACSTGWFDASLSPGLFNVFGSANHTGTILGPVGSASGNTFFVHGDRRFGQMDFTSGLVGSSGGITSTGDVAIQASIRDGGDPGLEIFLAEGSGLDDSILSGTYHFGAFGMDAAGGTTIARWGRIQFDGAGSGSISVNVNAEGIVPPPGATTFNYAVAGDGGITWQFTGAQSLVGACTADGELAVLGGGIDPGDDPSFLVMVREASGFSDATMAGPWFLVGIAQEVGPNAYTAFTGGLTSNGAGSADVAGTVNAEGAISVVPQESVTTTLGDDGSLMLTTPGGDVFAGGLSASGRFGVLAGPTGAGGDPALYILLR